MIVDANRAAGMEPARRDANLRAHAELATVRKLGRGIVQDNGAVDAEFFAGTETKSNFLCGLGIGDHAAIFGRSPRFTFDEMAKIL